MTEERKMKKATIYLKNGSEILQGGTSFGKTETNAIINAHKKTANAWGLQTYVKKNDKLIPYDIIDTAVIFSNNPNLTE
jgi:hypothetical protein